MKLGSRFRTTVYIKENSIMTYDLTCLSLISMAAIVVKIDTPSGSFFSAQDSKHKIYVQAH